MPPPGASLTATFLDAVEEHFNQSTKDESIQEAKNIVPKQAIKNGATNRKGKKNYECKTDCGKQGTETACHKLSYRCTWLMTYHTVYTSIYMENVKDEIRARGVTNILDGIGIKDLIAILKWDEITRHRSKASAKSFTPLTDISECLI